MPKILDPLPVIADADQLLRHSLRNQVVTLRNKFFLHKPRGLSAAFSLYYSILAPYTPVCKFIEGRDPNLEKPRAIPRSRDRMQSLLKLRLNVVEYL